jgi:bifunctional N-acetylglucosamine-1-phosphate-uridyltransferase/glucosamine-1-phosphate-acetyltransferase GlmU-like protein
VRRCYAAQITEGKGTEFLWQGQALGDGHAVSLARDAFERERGRRPSHEMISLEALSM